MSQHPDFAAAVTQQIDLHDAVYQYRENESALRRLAKSRPSRNGGATLNAIERREGLRGRIELSLVLAGHHVLVGILTDERKLVTRVNDATPTNSRPELRARLTLARRSIRRLLPV